MRLITKVKKDNKGIVSIDNLRKKVQGMIIEYLNTTKYKNNPEMKINLMYIIECKVLTMKRGAHVLKKQTSELENWIAFHFKNIIQNKDIERYLSYSICDMLIEVVYEQLGKISEKDYRSVISKYKSIENVDDVINAIESGNIPESAYSSISVDLLKQSIDDFYKFYYRRKIK